MPKSLVPIDLPDAIARLRKQEQALASRLAELEGEVRGYEDTELPAYRHWLRVELGPRFVLLEELYQQIREKRILAERVHDLVEREGLHPREALYLVQHSKPEPADAEEREEEEPAEPTASKKGGWDADEIEARRQAKREAKREARRAKRAADRPAPAAPVERSRKKVLAVYRTLARKLHPDSPDAIRGERAQSLWLEVQQAYQERDLERLLAVSAWLGESDADQPASRAPSLGERHERIRLLRRSVSQLEKRRKAIALEPAWEFSRLAPKERRKLKSDAARELDEEIDQAQGGLAELEDFIESIGPPRAPRQKARRR